MGVRKFWQWLQDIGYYPDQDYVVSSTHSLLVDAKAFMYRFAYRVTLDDPNFCQTVADAIIAAFGTFERVAFVNDGTISNTHPKFETTIQRSETRKRNVQKNKKTRLELAEANEEQIERLDRAERAARGVSSEQSKIILECLAKHPTFTCVQCDGEADDYILKHHNDFDLVVSEDSDFLVGGVDCVLRGFATPRQAIYRTEEVLRLLHIDLTQLQEIASIAGNDYTRVGIRGLGLVHAYKLITKYGSCRAMFEQWSPKEHKHITVDDGFYARFNESMRMYNNDVDPDILLDVPSDVETRQQKETITTCDTTKHDTTRFFDLFMTKKRKHEEII